MKIILSILRDEPGSDCRKTKADGTVRGPIPRSGIAKKAKDDDVNNECLY